MTHGISLQAFLRAHIPDNAALQLVLHDIARASKYVSSAILHTNHLYTSTVNAHSDVQVALDVRSNTIIKDILFENHYIATLASEEEHSEISVHSDGIFTVVFDPLDGSSVVDANYSIGSIFGIYSGKTAIEQTPAEQIAALYIMYGPRTVLVLSTGNGVHEFVLNEQGEYLCSRTNIRISETTTYYSPGNLRAFTENGSTTAVLHHWLHAAYTLRYSGCMVADMHHIFTKKHGIFIYLGSLQYPTGKLRLLYECGPFAYIIHHAGGSAKSGKDTILSLKIQSLTDTCPIIIGSSLEVEHVVSVLLH
jgi:fructose-1,6-bisphosphatase I